MRAVALVLLTAGALGAAAPLLAARRPDPTRIQVSALEFEYRLSRLSVKQGPAVIELVNYGEDEHDLMLHWGMRMMQAMHACSTPTLTVCVRKAFGLAWQAMNGSGR